MLFAVQFLIKQSVFLICIEIMNVLSRTSTRSTSTCHVVVDGIAVETIMERRVSISATNGAYLDWRPLKCDTTFAHHRHSGCGDNRNTDEEKEKRHVFSLIL